MSTTVNYSFNIVGNAAVVLNNITGGIDKMNTSVKKSAGLFQNLSAKIIVFNQASELLQNFNNSLMNGAEAGLELDKSLADLSAISGLTGDKLKEVEGYARQSAKAFGGSAAQGVESYKLILSQLAPEIAEVPSALSAMGKHVNVLSKTMGGNATAAAEVLTTAMNQYQVSLDDPTRASEKMAEMMNVMAAAAAVGSAELPAIKQALEQSGMAAKMSGVSFEELNASIQVLDKAGKKGAEGGVAIRNALSILGQGRFMPKKTADALMSAGIDVEALGDKSLTLATRLKMLQPVMNDSALIGEIFGRENSNAGTALIAGVSKIEEYTKAVRGTQTATEQANIVMESQSEKLARVKAAFDNVKISMFNALGGALPYLQVSMEILVPLSQSIPLFSALGSAIAYVTNAEKMKALWDGVLATKTTILTGVTWLWNAALAANPILWVVLGIGALVAALVLAWNKLDWFRGGVMAAWESIKQFGIILKDFVIDRIKGIISGIAGIGGALVKLFKGDFTGAWQTAKQAAGDLIGIDAVKNSVGKAKDAGKEIAGAYQEGVKQVAYKKQAAGLKNGIDVPVIPGTSTVPGAGTSPDNPVAPTTKAIAEGGTRNTTLTINLNNLVENIHFSGNMKENANNLQAQVEETLLRVINIAKATA
ncbi:MAG: phage tail tape measure protein [Bacteroidales bacterium]|mgnify:CR=1 FL=1|nr:phage tail tape measure protein [Bacteroidales bacterium]HOI32011.1 phage tail tape measure protein [Bacteroidales bacterium]